MPELPEVEITRQSLVPHMEKSTITEANIFRADLRYPFPENFCETIKNQTINAIERRSKYLLFHLGNKHVILSHLGMSGNMQIYNQPRANRNKHDHVIFHLSNGKEFVFNDPRRFGLMTLCPNNQLDSHKHLANLGPEPLTDAFDADYLHTALANKNTPIKQAIMDNAIVVGVGNIYASESLFRSHIHPTTPSKQISKTKLSELVAAIKETLHIAIQAGGSTLKDFSDSDGNSGYFQHQFLVYNRAGEACVICEAPIEKRMIGQRSSFFCPSCQPC